VLTLSCANHHLHDGLSCKRCSVLSPQDEAFSRSLVRLGASLWLQSVVLAAAYWLEGAPDGPAPAGQCHACSIGMAAGRWSAGRWIGATYVLVWGLWG
jgi:hypothetical protein